MGKNIKDGFCVSVGQKQKKHFGKYRKSILETPNLFEGQINSFNWLLKDGIKEVFQEFGSIKDYSEKKLIHVLFLLVIFSYKYCRLKKKVKIRYLRILFIFYYKK
jgi:DNA-directed RNA polymerase beta subunit